MRPRKRFGQHFLHDPAVVQRIVSAIAPRADEHIVEIGPGRGVLTHALLALPHASLDAIEIDRDLAATLARELAAPAARLHAADALEFDFGALARAHGGRLRIVGNLPYNISTPLLFHLVANADSLVDLHLMLQREVVARIAARPGSSDYGRLTVMLARRLSAERLFDIGPGAFQPPPRVWSGLVRLKVRERPAFEAGPLFAEIVATAFSHRRKTLRNALQSRLTAAQIEACGIDPGVRPETLAPESFAALARVAAAASIG